LIEGLKAVERIVRASCHIDLNFSCQHRHLSLLLPCLDVLFIVKLEKVILSRLRLLHTLINF
jgi:hypothetical protein